MLRELEVQELVKVRRRSRMVPSPRRPLVGPLFADVLLKTGGLQRRRRTLATVLSSSPARGSADEVAHGGWQ